MSNVLDMAEHRPAPPALDVELPLEIIKRLFAAGKISRHAYFLGAIVLARFQECGEYSCIFTRADVQSTYTLVDGEAFGAPANCEHSEFCAALRMLQHFCGIHSHIKANRAGKSTRHNHFTEPYLHKGPDALREVIRNTTPIYFQWNPADSDALLADIRELITHSMLVARFAHIQIAKTST